MSNDQSVLLVDLYNFVAFEKILLSCTTRYISTLTIINGF